MSSEFVDDKIEQLVFKYDPKWDRKSTWIHDGYETCEKVAFDLLFGVDKWTIRYRFEDGGYEGETIVIVQDNSKSSSKLDAWGIFKYYWGSCSHCDTLEGCGVVAAVREIIEGRAK